MTIICIGYFDKFSRFFIDIEKQLKLNHTAPIHFKILSIHFSGFLYSLLRIKKSSWIALKAWALVRKNKKKYTEAILQSDTYKGLDYKKYTAFHINLNKKVSNHDLQLQALAYIDLFEALYQINQPDYLLTIGDSRLCIEIAVALAKLRNIKIYYIEQGPFNTTFFDNKGVNANLSFRDRSYCSEIDNKNNTLEIELSKDSKKYSRSYLYRGIDILLMKIFQQSSFYPPDIKYTDINSFKVKQSCQITSTKKNEVTKLFLLILQIPLDVNMISHSNIFRSHYDILESVYSQLPEKSTLIVREHPLYINKYESKIYRYISKNNIKIENSTPLKDSITKSDVIIVNNSTVGIEAILKYKTVIVLGNAFYDNENVCIKLKHKDDLKKILETAIKHKPNRILIDNFKNLLFNTVLLKGAITDKNLKASKHIANHLLDKN